MRRLLLSTSSSYLLISSWPLSFFISFAMLRTFFMTPLRRLSWSLSARDVLHVICDSSKSTSSSPPRSCLCWSIWSALMLSFREIVNSLTGLIYEAIIILFMTSGVLSASSMLREERLLSDFFGFTTRSPLEDLSKYTIESVVILCSLHHDAG